MNFQTSCMVLVTDEQQQIKLDKWMKSIGWQLLGCRKGGPRFLMADTDQNAALWLELDESAQKWHCGDFYDCGENIEMFKALAAMNDENDREQWFITRAVTRFGRVKGTVQTENGGRLILPGDWFKVLISQANDIKAKMTPAGKPRWLFHKVTKDEIIEHFTQSGHERQQK